MKVKYIGNYREEASVKFKGVSFTKGEATDVTEEWYSAHECPKLEADLKAEVKPAKVDLKPKAKQKAK